MKTEEMTTQEFAKALNGLAANITKVDKYDACIFFKHDPVTPLDIRTVEDYLSGVVDKIKNVELAAKLFKFFQARAKDYVELENRRNKKLAS